MEELISWMREYNSTVSEGEKLRFYGFDMQNPETSYEFLKNYCISKGLTSAEEFDKNLDCIEKGEIIESIQMLKKSVESTMAELRESIYGKRFKDNINTFIQIPSQEERIGLV